MTLKRIILEEGDLKLNAFYIYTFINNNNNNNIEEFCHESLKKYIYRENNPTRINAFEKLLWKPPTAGTITTEEEEEEEKMSKKIINHYFEKGFSNYDAINATLKDSYDLSKRYINPQLFLLNEYESLTQRKFILHLVNFMEKRKKKNKKEEEEEDYDQPEVQLLALIKLWHLINIRADILAEKFIPLAFSSWFARYPFYTDYFSVIASNEIKEEFYKSFLNSIISVKNKTVNSVNNDIKTVLKKYTNKFFYKLLV